MDWFGRFGIRPDLFFLSPDLAMLRFRRSHASEREPPSAQCQACFAGSQRRYCFFAILPRTQKNSPGVSAGVSFFAGYMADVRYGKCCRCIHFSAPKQSQCGNHLLFPGNDALQECLMIVYFCAAESLTDDLLIAQEEKGCSFAEHVCNHIRLFPGGDAFRPGNHSFAAAYPRNPWS